MALDTNSIYMANALIAIKLTGLIKALFA